jgi:DNA modification methylase
MVENGWRNLSPKPNKKPIFAARHTIDHFCAAKHGVIDVTLGIGTYVIASMLSGRPFGGFDKC